MVNYNQYYGEHRQRACTYLKKQIQDEEDEAKVYDYMTEVFLSLHPEVSSVQDLAALKAAQSGEIKLLRKIYNSFCVG